MLCLQCQCLTCVCCCCYFSILSCALGIQMSAPWHIVRVSIILLWCCIYQVAYSCRFVYYSQKVVQWHTMKANLFFCLFFFGGGFVDVLPLTAPPPPPHPHPLPPIQSESHSQMLWTRSRHDVGLIWMHHACGHFHSGSLFKEKAKTEMYHLTYTLLVLS